MKTNDKSGKHLDDSFVHVTSDGRVYVDLEKKLRTPEAQRIMRKIQDKLGEKTSSNKDR